MRRLNKKLITLAFALTISLTYAQNKANNHSEKRLDSVKTEKLTTKQLLSKEFDWDRLIRAIIQVESGGNPRTIGGNSAGILQITPVCLKDCNSILQQKKINKRYTMNDRFNVEKSIEMFKLYQEKYNPGNNIEKAIRLWNGGPGYSVRGTEAYFQRVMKYYKKSGT